MYRAAEFGIDVSFEEIFHIRFIVCVNRLGFFVSLFINPLVAFVKFFGIFDKSFLFCGE